MYIIRKMFQFEAAHQLTGLEDLNPQHRCMRLHGHSYKVEIVLGSRELDHHSFVRDYTDLKSFADWLDETCDHRFLNDVVSFQTTAENLAEFFWKKAESLYGALVIEAQVSETGKTWAFYRPDEPRDVIRELRAAMQRDPSIAHEILNHANPRVGGES